MAGWDDITALPNDFDGVVRLFPLPNLVLFPHAMQALRIFEPRYCDMLADSLASDRLITIATLTHGIGDLLSHKPKIADVVCIGKIVSHTEAEDGRHNILLVGAKRALIRREIATNRSFRMAEVSVQDDVIPHSADPERQSLRRAIIDSFARIVPMTTSVQHNLQELMEGHMGLGPITDIIAFSLQLNWQSKLQLLSEANIDQRAQLLIRLLDGYIATKQEPAGSGPINDLLSPQPPEASNDGLPPFSTN